MFGDVDIEFAGTTKQNQLAPILHEALNLDRFIEGILDEPHDRKYIGLFISTILMNTGLAKKIIKPEPKHLHVVQT